MGDRVAEKVDTTDENRNQITPELKRLVEQNLPSRLKNSFNVMARAFVPDINKNDLQDYLPRFFILEFKRIKKTNVASTKEFRTWANSYQIDVGVFKTFFETEREITNRSKPLNYDALDGYLHSKQGKPTIAQLTGRPIIYNSVNRVD